MEFEVTLPGEGRDRVFRVTLKYVTQIDLRLLDDSLHPPSNNGFPHPVPADSIQALDVIMRHLPSLR